MCGIAGYFGKKSISSNRVGECLDLMQRRGPDYSGFYERHLSNGRNIYLLHSRLSIIDLDERANQPMRIGNDVMVFNGELYSYCEQQRKLEESGVSFKTTSDSEILLSTFVRHGISGLDNCEGMWAFGVFNESNENLSLCRDRFGEKPLYLYRTEDGIYFASEIKFIFSLLGRRASVNINQLYRYMVNGYKSLQKTPDTFFEGIEELGSCELLTIGNNGKEKKERYWHPVFTEDESMGYDDAVEGVRSRLIRSMRLRLRADVPIAFCLSGGIDSNSLISIAKRVFNYDVHGFTIINTDQRYEEQEMVDHAVAELGIRHSPVPISTESFLENISELICYHDSPIYTISYYVHWLLMRNVSEQGYRISVSGTGADELLTGYYDHHNLYLYEMQDSDDYDLCYAGWKKNVQPFVRNPYLRKANLYIENPSERGHVYLNNDLFSEYLCQDWFEEFSETNYTDSLLRNRMLNEMFNEAVPIILHEDDLNAMYYSIENRSPYLDRELFEFCSQIPSRYLVRDGLAKVVLRDAMKGIVPEKILWNPRKVGFNAPVLSFLDVKNPSVRSQLMDNSEIFNHVRRDKIETLMNKEELANSESKFLFYFLNSKMFLEQFS